MIKEKAKNRKQNIIYLLISFIFITGNICIAESEKDYMDIGKAYYAKGDFARAIENFQKAAGLNPKSAQVHLSLGHAYYGSQMFEQALEEYKKTKELSPDTAEACRGLAGLYADTGKFEEAEEEILKAIKLSPDNSEYRFTLGMIYVATKRWEDAAREYSLLKSKDIQGVNYSQNLRLMVLYSRIFGATTGKQGGIEYSMPFERFDKKELPKELLEYFDRARKSDALKAIEILKDSLKIKETAAAHHDLGAIYFKLGNCQEAVAHLQKSKELNIESNLSYLALSEAYFHCNRNQEGFDILKEFLQNHPDDILVTYVLSDRYIALKDYESSVKMLEKLRDLDKVIFSLIEDEYKIAKEKVANTKNN